MRELRVEDALLYLDQVKVEFGDRPHIYNEFLEIMKTFKTQQIDTPGVIRRVSNLFRGNRRLVLGFNTFLPEGYQIELPPDGEGPPVAVYRAPGSNITQVLQESSESQAHQVGRGNPPMGQQQSMPPPHAAQQPPMRHVPPAHGHPGMRGPPPPQPSMQHSQPPGGGGQPMMLHDSQPGMQVRPPQHSMGQSVQQQQQPQHLPGGVHRPPPPPQQQQQQQQQQMSQGQMPPHDGNMPPGGPRPPHMQGAAPPPLMNGQGAMRGGPRGQQQAGMGPPPPGYADQNAMSPQQATSTSPPQQQQPGAQQQQPLEFDHAINYVTTIKKRFSAQPETYKKFLEILHTYQKEQRGIKEVLEEVSSLFADHPDLLKEFTYFLPDAVQAQAKAQLEQAAKEAEARKRERTKQASMMQAPGLQQPVKAGTPRGPGRPIEYDRNAIHVPFGAMQGRTEEQENLIIRSAHYGVVSFDPVRPPRRNEITPSQAAAKKGRPTAIPELPIQPNTTEAAFFQKVRDHLERRELQSERQPGSRRHTPYVEFLKCLHLFGAGVVNRDELLQLLKTLFTYGHAPKSSSSSREMASIAHAAQDLLREFEEILTGRGPFAAQEAALKEKSKYGAMRVRDFDFAHVGHPTPSYFAYPSDYPKSLFLNNPGQSQTDAEVLNDAVVCVGAEKGNAPSIEDYDGVRVRHNAYEEMMFRIEDERYELDLAIERNTHALQQIEPLAEEVQALRDQEEKDGQPIGRLQYSLNRYALNSIHTNAIARIYGEKGDEVLQHLSRNPLVVLPIVYQRLKQKDAEWRKLQAELNPKWAKACEDSYEGSLDVLCYFKRRGLERRAAPARLRDDCIHAGSYCRHPGRLKKDDETAEPFKPTFGLRLDDPGAILYQPFVKVSCRPGSAAHKDAFELVTTYIRANSLISRLDRERIGRIWAEFMTPWFGYPARWVVDEVHQSFSGKLTPNIVKFAPGQRVFTLFGEGTIGLIVKEANNSGIKYRVKLSFATAYVSPTAILYAIPSTDAPFVRRDGLMVRDESVFDTNTGSPQLDEKHQLLFGTESIYLFLRLYSFLCSVLADTREHCVAFPPPPDPALSYYSPARDEAYTPVSYSSAICALKQVLSKRMDPKRFEAIGRKLSKEKVHQLAALPKLVERCATYLVKVAKEDALLHLYDFCNHRAADPVVVREHCFTVASDVSYRIQYQHSTGELYFSHLPKGEILLTTPSDDIKSFSEEEAGENLSPMEEDDDYDQIEEYDDTNGGQPALKRQRLK